jgi:hypothetical protein
VTGTGKVQEIAYEFPPKSAPGLMFSVGGKLQASIALTKAPGKTEAAGGEVTVGEFKEADVRQRGRSWLSSFSAMLAKVEWTAAEPIEGVKVSGSLELLEATLEEGKNVDVSLIKAVAEVSGDALALSKHIGGPGPLQPLLDRGAEIKIAGALEIGLDPTAASSLAKAQAAKVRAEKLAEETAELAKKNQKAVKNLQQQIASRDAALKRGKVRGKGGRWKVLSKADKSKIAKEIADRKAELGKLKDALKAKQAAAKVAKSEFDDALRGLAKGIGKRWGDAIKKALGKSLMKIAGALGIVMTLIDIAIFIDAVAKAGIDPGFHDKGDSGTPGGDPEAGAGGAGGDSSAGAGAGAGGGEYDLEGDGGLSDEERIDVSEEATAALHPAAQQLVEALYGEDSGVSPGQLEVFNQIVPEDLTPEEVELVIARVKGAGASSTGGVQTSVIKAVREVRQRQTISEPEAAPAGGPAGQTGTGPRVGEEGGPMQTPDQPSEGGGTVLDVKTLEFSVVGGVDPDKTYASGQPVMMSIVVTHEFETIPVTFPARVVSQTQTPTEDVFTLENTAQWRKAKRDGIEIFMAAGALFSARWARTAAPAAAP